MRTSLSENTKEFLNKIEEIRKFKHECLNCEHLFNETYARRDGCDACPRCLHSYYEELGR